MEKKKKIFKWVPELVTSLSGKPIYVDDRGHQVTDKNRARKFDTQENCLLWCRKHAKDAHGLEHYDDHTEEHELYIPTMIIEESNVRIL